jgi:DNA-directed RNA polymerase subunit RPC12/RpoP
MRNMNRYTCTRCGLTLPSGQGGQMYVTDNEGERSICPHPGEEAHVAHLLGVKEEALIRAFARETSEKGNHTTQHHDGLFHFALSRTGFLSDCLCRDCLAQFKLDMHRDVKRCPHCSSSHVKTVRELLRHRCPECREGTIEEYKTGGSRRGHSHKSPMRSEFSRWEDFFSLGS